MTFEIFSQIHKTEKVHFLSMEHLRMIILIFSEATFKLGIFEKGMKKGRFRLEFGGGGGQRFWGSQTTL